MNIKKFAALSALTLALTVTASANEYGVMPISAGLDGQEFQAYMGARTMGGYTGTLTVNGAVLNTSATPATINNAIVPLRLVAEADGGYAEWFPAENLSIFGFDGVTLDVDTTTGNILANWSETGLKATFIDGVTFAPVALFGMMDGYALAESGANLTITTPSNSVVAQVAKKVQAAAPIPMTMKVGASDLEARYGITASNFESLTGEMPMMQSAGTIIVAEVASGKMDAAKADLETVRAGIEAGFKDYLIDQYEMAQAGEIVTKGNYIMLIIAEDATAGVAAFNAAI